MPKRITISRVDFSGEKLGKVTRTDEGYLTGEIPVAKVGVLTYVLKDGSIRKELVTEDTLFNQDSMSTLKMKPITDQHPPERLLNSRTVKRRKVGFTGENIKRDGNFLVVPATITDSDAIDSVENGRQELSPGYEVTLIMESGVHDGENYDAIQISRRYNHVAICDQARGGSDLRIALDDKKYSEVHIDGFDVNDAVLTYQARQNLPDSAFCFIRGSGENKVRKFPAHDAAHVRNGLARLPQSNLTPAEKASVRACLTRKAKQFGVQVSKDSQFDIELDISLDEYNINERESKLFKRKEKAMPQIRIDNIDYEADQQVINHLNRVVDEKDGFKIKLDEQKVKLDSVTQEKDDLQKKLDEKEKTYNEDVSKAVSARLSVVKIANDVLDEKELKDIEKLDNLEIKKKVILKKSPEAKLDDKEEAYIDARFDAVGEELEQLRKDGKMKDQRQKVFHKGDGTGTGDKVEKARNDMVDDLEKGYLKDPNKPDKKE